MGTSCWAAGRDHHFSILQMCKLRPFFLHHNPIPNILAQVQGHQLDSPVFFCTLWGPIKPNFVTSLAAGTRRFPSVPWVGWRG